MGRFVVHVVPGSGHSGPAGRHGGLPRLRLRSRPEGGRANAEAERLLTALLGTTVRLASGERSRRKTFGAGLDDQLLEARLREVFGPPGDG